MSCAKGNNSLQIVENAENKYKNNILWLFLDLSFKIKQIEATFLYSLLEEIIEMLNCGIKVFVEIWLTR